MEEVIERNNKGDVRGGRVSKGQNHFGMECALYGLGQDMDNGFYVI